MTFLLFRVTDGAPKHQMGIGDLRKIDYIIRVIILVRVRIVANGSQKNSRHPKKTLISKNSCQCLNLKKSQNTIGEK